MNDLKFTDNSYGVNISIEEFDRLVKTTSYPDNLGDDLFRHILYAVQTNSPFKLPKIIKVQMNDAKVYEDYCKIKDNLNYFGILIIESIENPPTASMNWIYVCDKIVSLKQLKSDIEKYVEVNEILNNTIPKYVYCSEVRTYQQFVQFNEILNEYNSFTEFLYYIPNFEIEKNREDISTLCNFYEKKGIAYTKLYISDLLFSDTKIIGNVYSDYPIYMENMYKYLKGLNTAILLCFDGVSKRIDFTSIDGDKYKALFAALCIYSIETGNIVYSQGNSADYYKILHDFMKLDYCDKSIQTKCDLFDDYMLMNTVNINMTRLVKINKVHKRVALKYFALTDMLSSYIDNTLIVPSTDEFALEDIEIIDTVDFLVQYSKKYASELDCNKVLEDSPYLGIDRFAKLIVGALSKYINKWESLVKLKDIIVFNYKGLLYIGCAKINNTIDCNIYATTIHNDVTVSSLSGITSKNLFRLNACCDYPNLYDSYNISKFFELKHLNILDDLRKLYFYYELQSIKGYDRSFVLYNTPTNVREYLYNKIYINNFKVQEYLFPVIKQHLDFEECYKNGVITGYGNINMTYAENGKAKILLNRNMFGSDRKIREILGAD